MNPNIYLFASLGGKVRAAKLTKEERIASARHAASFPKKCRQRPLRERFGARYIPEPFTCCWLWSGDIHDQFGYGLILVGKRTTLAHRVSWELHHGPIPDGLCVLHRCDTPPCVNPDHLFLGTQADNMRDKAVKNRNPGVRKLTTEEARTIKFSRKPTTALARHFKVACSTISDIRHDRNWKHIT